MTDTLPAGKRNRISLEYEIRVSGLGRWHKTTNQLGFLQVYIDRRGILVQCRNRTELASLFQRLQLLLTQKLFHRDCNFKNFKPLH